MVDTGDLKSPGSDTVPVRVRSPAPLFEYRGVEQLVARRAHNPEVAGSSPVSATINVLKSQDFRTFSLFFIRKDYAKNLGQRRDPDTDPYGEMFVYCSVAQDSMRRFLPFSEVLWILFCPCRLIENIEPALKVLS